MASNNLGTKRVCPKCDAKFYDFGATNPIKCPKCGHSWKDTAAKKVPAALKKEAKPAPKPVKKVAVEDELIEMAGDLPEVEDGGAVEELEPMEDEGVELTSLEEVEEHEEEEEADPNSDDAEDEMFTELGGDKIIDDFEDHNDDEDEDDEDANTEDDEDDGDDHEDENDRRTNRRRK